MNTHPVWGQPRHVIYVVVGVVVLLIVGGLWLADYNSPQKKLDRCVSQEQKSGRWPGYTPMTALITCCDIKLHQAPYENTALTCNG